MEVEEEKLEELMRSNVKEIVETVRSMTRSELIQSLVNAGIMNKDGKLTKKYQLLKKLRKTKIKLKKKSNKTARSN